MAGGGLSPAHSLRRADVQCVNPARNTPGGFKPTVPYRGVTCPGFQSCCGFQVRAYALVCNSLQPYGAAHDQFCAICEIGEDGAQDNITDDGDRPPLTPPSLPLINPRATAASALTLSTHPHLPSDQAFTNGRFIHFGSHQYQSCCYSSARSQVQCLFEL